MPHNPKSRRVICIETGELFLSVKKAARKFGVGDWIVLGMLQGKKTTVLTGYSFAYVDEPKHEKN